MFTHIASHPCSELPKSMFTGCNKRSEKGLELFSPGKTIRSRKIRARLQNSETESRRRNIEAEACKEIQLNCAFIITSSCDQMSLVMFIDQYLKRSANLFAENITASPFNNCQLSCIGLFQLKSIHPHIDLYLKFVERTVLKFILTNWLPKLPICYKINQCIKSTLKPQSVIFSANKFACLFKY